MTIGAPTNRLRWLACLPTRILAGWLLVAALVGGGEPAVAETSSQVTASATTRQQPSAEAVRELNAEPAQAGPAAEVTVLWRPADRPIGVLLPGGLVQRGPPRG